MVVYCPVKDALCFLDLLPRLVTASGQRDGCRQYTPNPPGVCAIRHSSLSCLAVTAIQPADESTTSHTLAFHPLPTTETNCGWR